MAGYGPIFDHFFDSSIMEETVAVRYVMMSLVVLSDAEGVVDMTPESIARRLKMPRRQLEDALERLSRSDEMSRGDEQAGRRIVPIEGRRYGFVVVNKAKYREMAADLGRRAAEAKRKRNARVRTRPDVSGRVRKNPPSEAEAKAEEETGTLRVPGRAGRRLTRSQRDVRELELAFESADAKPPAPRALARILRQYRDALPGDDDPGKAALLRDVASAGAAGLLAKGPRYALGVLNGQLERGRAGQGVSVGRSKPRDRSAAPETVAAAAALDEALASPKEVEP